METLKITRITRFTEDREGNPLITSKGKPYTRVLINTDKYEGQNISGFGNKMNQNWKEGDTIEVLVEKKGQWLNFKTQLPTVSPQALDDLKVKIENIESRLSKLEMGKEEPTSDDNNPDLPF